MVFTGICPQCSQQISDDKMVNGLVLCQCGWSDTTSTTTAAKKAEKNTIKTLIGTAALLVAMYAHLLNWGSYAVEIPFVKLGEFTGLLSKEGYSELADVCVILNKWDCAKDALTEIYTTKRDPAGLAARARLETRLGETQNALKTYAAYFAVGGNTIEAANFYGDLLDSANRHDEAVKAYELAIANSGAFLPVKSITGIEPKQPGALTEIRTHETRWKNHRHQRHGD